MIAEGQQHCSAEPSGEASRRVVATASHTLSGEGPPAEVALRSGPGPGPAGRPFPSAPDPAPAERKAWPQRAAFARAAVDLAAAETDSDEARAAAAAAAGALVELSDAGDDGALRTLLRPDPRGDQQVSWTVACYQIGDLTPAELRDFPDPGEAVAALVRCPDASHLAGELIASDDLGLRWTALVRTGGRVAFQHLDVTTAGAVGDTGRLHTAVAGWQRRLRSWEGERLAGTYSAERRGGDRPDGATWSVAVRQPPGAGRAAGWQPGERVGPGADPVAGGAVELGLGLGLGQLLEAVRSLERHVERHDADRQHLAVGLALVESRLGALEQDLCQLTDAIRATGRSGPVSAMLPARPPGVAPLSRAALDAGRREARRWTDSALRSLRRVLEQR